MEFECERCGKVMNIDRGVYGVSVSRLSPAREPSGPLVEENMWVSGTYCSEKCLEKSLNQIRSELIAWLQEEQRAQT